MNYCFLRFLWFFWHFDPSLPKELSFMACHQRSLDQTLGLFPDQSAERVTCNTRNTTVVSDRVVWHFEWTCHFEIRRGIKSLTSWQKKNETCFDLLWLLASTHSKKLCGPLPSVFLKFLPFLLPETASSACLRKSIIFADSGDAEQIKGKYIMSCVHIYSK